MKQKEIENINLALIEINHVIAKINSLQSFGDVMVSAQENQFEYIKSNLKYAAEKLNSLILKKQH